MLQIVESHTLDQTMIVIKPERSHNRILFEIYLLIFIVTNFNK